MGVTRIEPRSATFDEQVKTPFYQSAISAVAVSLLVVLVAISVFGLGYGLVIRASVIGFVVAFFCVWLILLADARSLLRVRSISLPSDGVPPPGRYEYSRDLVLVNPKREEPPKRADRAERFMGFVRAAERSTSLRYLEAEGYSREEIADFRSILLRLKYATWRGSDVRQGWALTASADEILRACV